MSNESECVMKHMQLLGKQVKDKVTGFKGTVSSLCFDLYGCIQAAVTPKVSKENKPDDGRWYDVQRLVVQGKPVMPVPDFNKNYPIDKGPAPKPTRAMHWRSRHP